jgi:hypothetical protein
LEAKQLRLQSQRRWCSASTSEGEIRAAGKTMLMLAKEQGEDLLRLKEQTPHGQFKERVERETCVSYRTARVYMQTAKMAARGHFDPTLSLRAYLDQQQPAAKPQRPPLTRDDATYILKINALAERGATAGERDAAEAKLDGLAQQYGRTMDQLVKQSEKLFIRARDRKTRPASASGQAA